MRILLSIGSYHPGHGGPFFSVGNLARALAAAGHEIHLITADYPHLPAQRPPEGVTLDSIPAKLVPGLRQSFVLGCRDWIDGTIRDVRPEVIHDNGLWLTLNHQVSKAASRQGIPLMLSPRGCLDPWAMQYRNWKKRVALKLYQRRDLERVDVFHAASELEAESIRRMGLTQPIAVIPNGIELPAATKLGDGSWEMGKDNYALFLGRLHPIKNLPTLLRAWAEVRPEGWRLVLAGSDEEGHRAELEDLARELGIGEIVDFPGPVYGDAKWEVLRGASLAFLISHSENFGISAAEALGCGVPVIASKTTPWECLEIETIGWWVPGDVEGISGALSRFLSLPDAEKCEISRKALNYAQHNFAWPAIAERFSHLYSWVAGTGDQPQDVLT